jgi:hypothetical protein
MAAPAQQPRVLEARDPLPDAVFLHDLSDPSAKVAGGAASRESLRSLRPADPLQIIRLIERRRFC